LPGAARPAPPLGVLTDGGTVRLRLITSCARRSARPPFVASGRPGGQAGKDRAFPLPPRPTDDASGPDACRNPVLDGELAVDKDGIDALREAPWLLVRGGVTHTRRIEEHQIGDTPRDQPPAVAETEALAGICGHLP